MNVELSTALTVAVVFLAAGYVKGIVGIGLPIFAVSLLSHLMGIREAIYITLAPAMLTSLAQAVAGPALRIILTRLWPMLLTGIVCIAIAAKLTLSGDGKLLAILVGTLIIVYSAASLINLRLPPPRSWEKFWTPVIGVIGGSLGGMTGMFSMPAVPYMQTLRFNRDELIQSIAIWFSTGAAVMLLVIGFHGTFTPKLLTLTSIAIVTSLAGIWIGGKARGRMSEGIFMKVFLVAFLILGAAIIYRAI